VHGRGPVRCQLLNDNNSYLIMQPPLLFPGFSRGSAHLVTVRAVVHAQHLVERQGCSNGPQGPLQRYGHKGAEQDGAVQCHLHAAGTPAIALLQVQRWWGMIPARCTSFTSGRLPVPVCMQAGAKKTAKSGESADVPSEISCRFSSVAGPAWPLAYLVRISLPSLVACRR